MELYAKSKAKQLSIKEVEALKETLESFLDSLEGILTPKEEQIIIQQIQKIQNQKEEKQKTLKEHEEDIVKCAEAFFRGYGKYFTEIEKILILQACRQHDWGKANLLFQSKVCQKVRDNLSEPEKKISQIPHGFLSAVSISYKEFQKLYEGLEKDDFKAFMTAIYYHHDRKDDFIQDDIKAYCQKYYLKYLSEYLKEERDKVYSSQMRKLLFRNNMSSIKLDVKPSLWNKYVLLKGMLNKFDYTVSAGYEFAEENSNLEEKRLVNNINKNMKEQQFALKPAQKFMQENVNKNLVVIAPTGSGKTEAALLWLNGEKGFYTLPLKVSANDIYRRIKDDYNYKDVELLHSDAMQKYLEESTNAADSIYQRYEKAKLLSNPLTICTVDQLFKFVYRALGTEIFAATLKYSKVILDEVQSYDPHIIATIITGLKQITEMGGRFAIITATFPPVLKYFMEKCGLIQGEQYEFRDFSKESDIIRHKVKIKSGEMNFDEILEKGRDKKVLVICNTVTKAQEVYEQIESQLEEEDLHLLHSRYVKKDRLQLEKMIKNFSENEEECGIWITTQIVEASLDIDFDVLYTEMCTVDSLLQRMGRCNRKGRYIPEEPNVIVYDNANGKGTVYYEDMYDRSLEKLYQYEDKIFTEELKTEYINAVYCTEEIKKTKYYEEIEYWLEHFSTIHPIEYTKEDVDKKFRNIHSITVLPDTLYEKNQVLFEEGVNLLRTPNINKDIKNIITSKFSSLTLGLTYYRYKDNGLNGIDVTTIGSHGDDRKNNYPVTQIHRTSMKYDFDPDTGRGKGLILGEIDDEACIL